MELNIVILYIFRNDLLETIIIIKVSKIKRLINIKLLQMSLFYFNTDFIDFFNINFTSGEHAKMSRS